MIVGVLVEVVGIVAAAEQDAATKKSLLESLREADTFSQLASNATPRILFRRVLFLGFVWFTFACAG